ncbi:unnamed protein product [Sphacelaria rigidula]
MLDGDEGSIVDVPLFVGEVQESRAQDSNLGASAAGVAGVDTDMLGSRSGTCGGSDVEPWSRHGKWKVPCFVKPVEGRNQLPPLALEVTTVTVKRFLSVDKSRVEFGQLAVGSKAVITLRVRNMGDDDVPVEGTGLNTVGPFEVVNAFRPLRARGGTHRCLLQFRPERAGIVSEILVLSSPLIGKSIRIPVRGEGVSPVLRMEPADGRLEMGHVLEGDIVERTVTLHNDSIFPLQYTTASWGPAPTDNYNHMKNFALVPCEGGVPAGESVTVKATFGPDHGRLWPFLAAYRIEARDQPDGGHVLRVRGRCVSRQLYVESAWPGLNPGDQVPAATEDALTPHPRDHTTATPARNTMGLQATTTPILPILLRFPKDSEDADPVGGGSGAAEAGDKSAPPLPATMTLVVGSVNTNDPKKASAGSFEVELSAEAKEAGYFRITPDKGIVAPGAKVEVTCAFEPPPLPPRTPGPAGGKRGAQEVGQWYRTAAMIHLRGGYRPLGSSEVHTVQVQLEGFVTA